MKIAAVSRNWILSSHRIILVELKNLTSDRRHCSIKTMGKLPTTTALSIYGHWTNAIASSAKKID